MVSPQSGDKNYQKIYNYLKNCLLSEENCSKTFCSESEGLSISHFDNLLVARFSLSLYMTFSVEGTRVVGRVN